MVDYETEPGTLRVDKKEGSEAEGRSVNSRGLVVTGGGGTLGRRRRDRGEQTAAGEGGADTGGLCYLCLEPASIQVSGGRYGQSEAGVVTTDQSENRSCGVNSSQHPSVLLQAATI